MTLSPDTAGGCPGHYRLGRLCPLCTICARLPVGGEQVAGCVRRVDGVDRCELYVSHETNVRAIPVGEKTADLGGALDTGTRRARWGADGDHVG
jgi:hypothetical protein